MPDVLIPLPGASNVTTGNRAVIDLPVDVDYATIFLTAKSTGTTDAKNVISNIRILADGAVFREHNVDDLRQINGANGSIYNSTDLETVKVHGREDFLWNPEAADFGIISTAGLKNLRMEIDLKPGLTAPALSGFVVVTKQKAIAPGKNIVRKIRKSTLDFVSAGSKTFRNLGFRGLIKRWHLSNTIVDSAEFTISGNPVYGPATRAQQKLHLEQNELVPVAGYFLIPFDATQYVQDGLVAALINESVLKVSVSAAGSVDMLEEYYEAIS